MKTTIDLVDGWTLTAASGHRDLPAILRHDTVPATVPGSVHTDLMVAGILADPYLDCNEDTQHWIGETAWRYQTTLVTDVLPGVTYELVFDGLDTVAHIELNGTPVAQTANMHRTYRFDVTDVLRNGGNELAVTFRPVREYTDAIKATLGDRPNVYPEPFQYVRKMACNFGWDWGPTLVTAGIWKSARLESWAGARLGAVRPHVGVDSAAGTVEVHVDVDRGSAEASALTVAVDVAGHGAQVDVPADATSVIVRLRVPDVELWWPRGHGAQPLYDLQVRLLGSDGTNLDRWARRVGFRTVALTTEPDAGGTSFVISVNDEPVFVRGVNWIPDDCFVSRVDEGRYRERIAQAVEANVNLLRIWGGGIYEKDELYDVCDELGVLVWQDFLFACSAYPEGEPMRSEVEAEARDNVSRLMPHPSLVLWNGNNENIWGYFDWGWQEPLAGRDWGWGFYDDLLPAVVAGVDPTRPYWTGSPWSGTLDLHPNDPAHGNSHSWEVWNRADYTTYAQSRPRFVSEFGYQGPPAWATLTRAVHDEPLLPDSPGVLHHQKADDGNGKLVRGMARHLPLPTSMADWHYLTQLNQARAITFGVEYFRSLAPHCTGLILWQLNDCWPVTSWAAIDGDGRRKPLWYALRRAYADRLLTLQPDEAGWRAVLVNDGSTAWSGDLVVARRDLDGAVLATDTRRVDVPAQGRLTVPIDPALSTPAESSQELVLAELGDRRAIQFFDEDVDVAFRPSDFELEVSDVAGGVELTVVARSLVRDIVVVNDRVDPDSVADEQIVTLLPGERHTFGVRTAVAAADARWRSSAVVRSVNDLPAYAAPETSGR